MRTQYRVDIETPAARAVVAAAREFVRHRRWWQDLPPDRPLPARMEAALEAALVALDVAGAEQAREDVRLFASQGGTGRVAL